MNVLTPREVDEKLQTIIKLAIMAVGGQGGGVLTGWIENMVRAQGFAAQATSVAGVSQRTGATIYYIEMAPMGDATPVFSLAPTSGDVDILIAAELMEAGRAIMRGFVTPDRTTLIASTHRALAVSEKMAPGDGIAEPDDVFAAAQLASDQLVMFDMDRVAVDNGSVISSSLFGALAGSGALPFPREAFEDAIRASGKGVEASLQSFAAAYERAETGEIESLQESATAAPETSAKGPKQQLDEWQGLVTDAASISASDMVIAGLRKTVEFQDVAYGKEYLDRLRKFAAVADADGELIETAAKYIANAMCYDDIIRVADRKTRRARFDRIATEMGSGDKPLHLTEYFHPRGEEMISLLPARLGEWIEARPRLAAWIDRRLNKGRRVRTDSLRGFLTLYFLGALRPRRRNSLRHKRELAWLNAWEARCLTAAKSGPALVVEILKCQRLIKGYSDTHTRGHTKFERVMEGAILLDGRDDAAEWIGRLREAALADEIGEVLEGAIETIRSFV